MSNNKVRPTLIIYTHKTRSIPEVLTTEFRYVVHNPTFFQVVPPKGKYQYFWTDAPNREEIRATFKLRDPDVKEYIIGEKAESKSKAIETEIKKIVEEPTPEVVTEPIVEPEVIPHEFVSETVVDENGDEQLIPDDLSTLSWPELKSLASKFTDKKSFKKDEAIIILTEAKGK